MWSNNKYFILVCIAGLWLGTVSSEAQFQTFPQASGSSISGENFDFEAKKPTPRSYKRHIEDNTKKQKIKTGKKQNKNYSCSKLQPYFSEKTTQRNKTLQRQRRRNG